MTEYNGILVCAETMGNKLTGVSAEIISAGTQLSKATGQPLSALVVAAEPHDAAKEAILLGVEKALSITSDPTPEQYAAFLKELCMKDVAPAVIVMAQNDIGRDVAPRLAARIGATVTLDCTGITVDEGTKEMFLTKPVYGGNALAVWAVSGFPQVITMRPGSYPSAATDEQRKGEVIALEIAPEAVAVKTRLLESTKDDSGGVKLEDARIIVAAGAGMGNKDGLALIEDLAQTLGAVVGVTRVPCDLGWLPMSMEIGQTGHIVAPDLYFAIGISGAPQHMAGCMGSKVIVAINRDEEANIFKVSDFGVVGDYRQILPSLIEKLKFLRKEGG